MSANSIDKRIKSSQISRGKVYPPEKYVYVKQLLKLNHQEDILVKSLAVAIDNMKIDTNIVQDILNEHRELTIKRKNFLNSLCKNVEDIGTEMESIKQIAKNTENIKKLDVNVYKLKLVKLSQKMHDFKKLDATQALVEDQATLETELREFEPDLAKYENIQKNIAYLLHCQSKVKCKKDRQDYKDVEDFRSLVAKTGHTENWNMDDHLYFLKKRKQCENIPALVNAIQEKYPDISTESIVNHEAWYKLYETLREKQKSAVKEWRKQKELEKQINVNEMYAAEDYFDEENVLNDMNIVENDGKTEVLEKMKPSRANTKGTSRSADSSNSIKKELIKKWRLEKENKRAMDEEQLKVRMKVKQEIEERRKQRRRRQLREMLRECREKQSLENSTRESNLQEKCKYNSALSKEYR